MSGGKRRLTVLQVSGGATPEPEEERPPWHWIALSTLLTFVGWLPLSAVATWLTPAVVPAAVDATSAVAPDGRWIAVALHATGFAVAAFLAGLVVGRFGGRAGRREAAAGSLSTAALAWGLALSQGAAGGVAVWALLLGALAGIGAGAGYAGGAVGVRRRR